MRSSCKNLPGGFFRHHSSNDYKETDSPRETPLDEAVERVLSFFISYYLNFGPLTAEWPAAGRRCAWSTGRDRLELPKSSMIF